MLFGYTMAVIAGFLLTATRNWTGENTASGAGLLAVFLPWLAARALMLGGDSLLHWATGADLLFMVGLWIALARPIVKTRQARQAPILLILFLLGAARLLSFLGATGAVEDGARIGIHGGLYLVLGLVLFMGRRVIPFFTRRGVGYEVEPRNDRWNDTATFILYPLFLLAEVLLPYHFAGALLAAALLVLNTLRLLGWHTIGIWQRPLLWSLFMSVLMINLGFLLRALMPVTTVPAFLPVHAYAVGGIGIVTISMMARVTLGHTGRNVHQAPAAVKLLLGGMVAAAVLRIFPPLVYQGDYTLWAAAAAALWIVSFLAFIIVFGPMLLRKRADEEKPGPEQRAS